METGVTTGMDDDEDDDDADADDDFFLSHIHESMIDEYALSKSTFQKHHPIADVRFQRKKPTFFEVSDRL